VTRKGVGNQEEKGGTGNGVERRGRKGVKGGKRMGLTSGRLWTNCANSAERIEVLFETHGNPIDIVLYTGVPIFPSGSMRPSPFYYPATCSRTACTATDQTVDEYRPSVMTTMMKLSLILLARCLHLHLLLLYLSAHHTCRHPSAVCVVAGVRLP